MLRNVGLRQSERVSQITDVPPAHRDDIHVNVRVFVKHGRELLPLPTDVEPVTLGEGLTPLLPDSGYSAAIGVAMAGLLQWLWLLFSCWRDGVAMKLVRPRCLKFPAEGTP